MPLRSALLTAALLVLASVVALPGFAAAPKPQPPAADMALQASDLPGGARVASQGYQKVGGFLAYYFRAFRLSAGRVGFVENDVGLNDTKLDAGLEALGGAFGLDGKSGRDLARGIARIALRGVNIKRREVHPRGLRFPDAGDLTFARRFTIAHRGTSLDVVASFMQLDRVFSLVFVASRPGRRVRMADIGPMLRALADHIRTTLSPHSTAPPVIAGTAKVGETLTAGNGTWDPATAPRRFSYQWERCTADQSRCLLFPGATGRTYNVATADRGARVRVAVTARNSVGTATAFSTPTAVVP